MTKNSHARPLASRWLSRLAEHQPVVSRDDIEREAAAELGIQYATDQTSEPGTEEQADAVPTTDTAPRRPGRLAGWLRGDSDSAARRERYEREAADELDRLIHRAGPAA